MAKKLSRREFQRNVGALTLAGTGVASAGSAETGTERLSLPPLFYNNDGSFLFFPDPPRTPEDFVYEAVGRFVGTQIGAVVCHMFGFGDAVPLFPHPRSGGRGDRSGHLSPRQRVETANLYPRTPGPGHRSLAAISGTGSRSRPPVLDRHAVQ